MTLKDTINDDKTVRVRQEVPWTDLEPLLERAQLRYARTEKDVAHTVGWSSSVFYDWRRKGVAPKTAWFVLQGYLGDTAHPFTIAELATMITAINAAFPSGAQKDLVLKIAKEIGDVA